MEQARLPGEHRVLPGAEMGQAVLDEASSARLAWSG